MIKNGLYNFIGGVFRIGLAIISVPILIRLIGIEQYGIWTLVSAAVSVIILAEAGLSISATFFLSGDLANQDNIAFAEHYTIILGTMFALATCAFVAMWFGAGNLVKFFPNLSIDQKEIAIQAVQIGGAVAWTRMIQQVFVGVEQAYGRYDTINLFNIAQAILFRGGLLLVAWRGGNIVQMMYWQALVSLAVLVALGTIVWLRLQQTQLRFRLKWRQFGPVFRYSLMTWLSSIGGTFFGQFDRLAIGAILTPLDLGIYGGITDMTRQINFISALPTQPLLPTVAHHASTERAVTSAIQEKIQQALQINAFVAFGLGSAMLIFAPFILNVVMSQATTALNLLAFRIAIVIYSLYSLNAVGYFILLGSNRVRLNMIIVTVSGFLSLVAISVGALYTGMVGGIIGNSVYMGTLLLTVISLHCYGIRLDLAFTWISVPTAILGAACILSMSPFVGQFEYQIAIVAIQSILLCIWFIRAQKLEPRLIINQIVHKLHPNQL
ncbi:MAG: oligosaccharide flippase family protein [Caldilineaceae bacterium]|nr:oligosaccharide flippase family protein [Caldilineaceae bacterium]